MRLNNYTILLCVLTSLSTLSASCSKRSDIVVVNPSLTQESTQSQSTQDPILDYLSRHANAPMPQNFPKATTTSSSQGETIEPSYVASEPRNLFNGVDLKGWNNETGGSPKGWTVESGLLRLSDPENGGDLLSNESFTDFILTFEWRFGLECNSGIKYKIEQPNGKGWIGLEYQIQDDAHVADGKIDNRKIASLFDVFPAKESSKISDFPVPSEKEPNGEFRQGKIVVVGNKVEHWIDGEKVLTFTIDSEEWNIAKSQSKFKNQKNFGLVGSSPILLQAHGYPIDFKSVTIQTLTPKN